MRWAQILSWLYGLLEDHPPPVSCLAIWKCKTGWGLFMAGAWFAVSIMHTSQRISEDNCIAG